MAAAAAGGAAGGCSPRGTSVGAGEASGTTEEPGRASPAPSAGSQAVCWGTQGGGGETGLLPSLPMLPGARGYRGLTPCPIHREMPGGDPWADLPHVKHDVVGGRSCPVLADHNAQPPRNSYFPTAGSRGITHGSSPAGVVGPPPLALLGSGFVSDAPLPGPRLARLAGLGIFGRRWCDQDSLFLCLAQAGSANIWVRRWSPLPGGSFGECLLLFLVQASKFNSALRIWKVK